MRYFFDLFDGDRRLDLGGIELDSDAAARQEAKLRALNGRLAHQLSLGAYCEIVVRDETDRAH
jgi:hypothetical protein